jgi:hypothetical protein
LLTHRGIERAELVFEPVGAGTVVLEVGGGPVVEDADGEQRQQGDRPDAAVLQEDAGHLGALSESDHATGVCRSSKVMSTPVTSFTYAPTASRQRPRLTLGDVRDRVGVAP